MKKLLIFACCLFFIPIISSSQDFIDSDHDGLTDTEELEIYFTDPDNADTDGDGYSDSTEIFYRYSPRHGQGKKLIEVDADGDYLNDDWELILGTGLMNPDSDGDLYLDGTEVAASYDPLSTDGGQLEKLINEFYFYFKSSCYDI